MLADIVKTHLQLTLAKGMNEEEQPARFSTTIRSYSKLIKLVEAQDTEGAEKHWRSHMEVAAKLLVKSDAKNKPVGSASRPVTGGTG